MMPTVLTYDSPEAPRLVDAALETGQTIIFPTDTIYGIGGNPWDRPTLERVCKLKNRSMDQPVTLHLPTLASIPRYAQTDARQWAMVEQPLPGPYTLLLPATPEAPASAVLNGTVGIRVPSHPFFSGAMTILDRPVFGTSINQHGRPPLTEINEIIDAFGSVELILVGPVSGEASSILDLTSNPPQAIRGHLPPNLVEPAG